MRWIESFELDASSLTSTFSSFEPGGFIKDYPQPLELSYNHWVKPQALPKEPTISPPPAYHPPSPRPVPNPILPRRSNPPPPPVGTSSNAIPVQPRTHNPSNHYTSQSQSQSPPRQPKPFNSKKKKRNDRGGGRSRSFDRDFDDGPSHRYESSFSSQQQNLGRSGSFKNFDEGPSHRPEPSSIQQQQQHQQPRSPNPMDVYSYSPQPVPFALPGIPFGKDGTPDIPDELRHALSSLPAPEAFVRLSLALFRLQRTNPVIFVV